MPYINRPYRKRSKYLDYVSRYIDPPEDSPPQTNFVVDLAPFPAKFLPDGRAVFPASLRKDALRMADRVVRPDLVIYATGYTQEFGFLDEESEYPTPEEANVRNVVKDGDETVAFIGFVRPGVGKFFFPNFPKSPTSLFFLRCYTSPSRDAGLFLDNTIKGWLKKTSASPALSSSFQEEFSHPVWG